MGIKTCLTHFTKQPKKDKSDQETLKKLNTQFSKELVLSQQKIGIKLVPPTFHHRQTLLRSLLTLAYVQRPEERSK